MKRFFTLLMCVILISDFVFFITKGKSISDIQWQELNTQFEFGELVVIFVLIYLFYRFLFWLASFIIFFIPSFFMFCIALLKYEKIISWFEKQKKEHAITKQELLHYAIVNNNIPAYKEYQKNNSDKIDKSNIQADLLFSVLIIFEIIFFYLDQTILWYTINEIVIDINEHILIFSYLFYGIVVVFLFMTAMQPLRLVIEKSLENYVYFEEKKTADSIKTEIYSDNIEEEKK